MDCKPSSFKISKLGSVVSGIWRVSLVATTDVSINEVLADKVEAHGGSTKDDRGDSKWWMIKKKGGKNTYSEIHLRDGKLQSSCHRTDLG